METAALPSKLSDAEKAELRKSFQKFAQDFRDRAGTLEVKDGGRGLASADDGKKPELRLGSLSREEAKWLDEGQVPAEKAAEVYAKKAYAVFRDGNFGEAKYFGEKWKKEMQPAAAAYGRADLESFEALLAEKFPEVDPMSREF
jgi:hypothetical protein